MDSRRLRIAIDARYLSHDLVGGVHSYVRDLIPALLRNAPEHDYVLWIDQKAPFELPEIAGSVSIRVLPWKNELSSIRNDLNIGKMMLKDGAQLAHFPANVGLAPGNLPTVVTLHDAINVLPIYDIIRGHPKDPRTIAMMSYLHAMTRLSMRRNPTIITVSNYSRHEIARHTGIDPDRISVVHRTQDSIFQLLPEHEAERARASWGFQRRVLVADAIKNPDCTLRAYRALSPELRRETDLVLFARREPSESVQQAAANSECRLFVGLERDDLVKLLNVADLLIFPSWYEGFGLPVVEAMACGTPVIASSRGSLPEVVGDGGLITDAEDHTAIAREINRLFNDPTAYAELRERALARSTQFSTDKEAQGVLDVYSSVIGAETQPRDAQFSRQRLPASTGASEVSRTD